MEKNLPLEASGDFLFNFIDNFTGHWSAPRSITGKGKCGQGWLRPLRICLLRFNGLLSDGMESYCSINIKDGEVFQWLARSTGHIPLDTVWRMLEE